MIPPYRDHIGDTNKMVTAVEWLSEELKSKGHALITTDGIFINVPNELLEQAKQMEKEQIREAYYKIGEDNPNHIFPINKTAEQYYNETYNK